MKIEIAPLATRDYFIVQDFVANEDRLVRYDGAHVTFPGGTLLPLAKAQKVKLVKEVDEPGVVREFVLALTPEQEVEPLLPASWAVEQTPSE